MKDTKHSSALPMTSLALPLILEAFFRVLISSVDTFMLSSYSDSAVAGVGLVAQYIFFLQILFNVISVGSSIVLTQYLGAGKTKECEQASRASLVMVGSVGIAVMLIVLCGAKGLLSCYTLDDAVRESALTYFILFGAFGAVFTAVNQLQGAVLRSYGYTLDAMFITIASNILNVIGNAISLYSPFGLPVFGVMGVALSSTFSQVAACALFIWRVKKHSEIVMQFNIAAIVRGIKNIPLKTYKAILLIGLPTAGESLLYNSAQITVMAMISRFGTDAMSATIYANTIVRFVYIFAIGMSNAVQIKTGYFVGAKMALTAYKRVYVYQIISSIISIGLVVALNIPPVKRYVISLFTADAATAALTGQLLLYSIIVETGRSVNLITISALKGSGDVRYPAILGVFSMWLIQVLGSYLLGFVFGFGVIGTRIAIGADECLRGIIVLVRWKSKRWMSKALV